MDNRKYIGMDVHQASISVAVADAGGKLVMECVIETKAATILEFLQGLRGSLKRSIFVNSSRVVGPTRRECCFGFMAFLSPGSEDAWISEACCC